MVSGRGRKSERIENRGKGYWYLYIHVRRGRIRESRRQGREM